MDPRLSHPASRRLAILAFALFSFASAATAETISGVVRDAQTGPLRSMIVSVYTAAGVLQASATTDINGRYEITVSNGSYRVLAYDPAGAYATSFADDAPSFEESPLTVLAPGQSATVNFLLRRGGVVTGRVTTSVGIRPDLTVAAYNLSGSRRGFTLTTSAGIYSIVLPPGSYKLAAYDDLGFFAPIFFNNRSSFGEADTITVAAGQTVSGIDFFVQLGARISGIVKGPGGSPIPNAAVIAYSATGTYVTFATTGSDGRFALTLPPGSYRLVAVDTAFVYAASYLGDAISFEASPALVLNAGQSLANISFELELGGTIEGRVIDATTGDALRDITVAAYNGDGSQRTFTKTGADGHFTLILPQGDFRLAAFDPAQVYATQFYPQQMAFGRGTAIAPIAGQTIALQPFTLSHGGKVTGTITDQATGVRIGGAVVSAYGTLGYLVATTTTSLAGTYTLLLSPGQYRLAAFDPQLRYAAAYSGQAHSFDESTPINVVADQQITEDFALGHGTAVTGRVIDDAGHPIAGLEVSALDDAQKRVATATTNAEGEFRMSLVPGSYKFVAIDPTGRYGSTFMGGATFFAATTVVVTASNSPRLTVTIEPPSRRRAIGH